MSPKSLNQTFLQTYKELEQILPVSVLQYEETLSAEASEKLRICRQIRNYMQHHPDGLSFLQPTQEMIEFLNACIYTEKTKAGVAADCMEKRPALSLKTMTLQSGIFAFASSKFEWLPVTDKDNKCIGLVSLHDFLLVYLSKNKTTKLETVFKDKDLQKKMITRPSITKQTPLADIDHGIYIVTNKNGTYAGLLLYSAMF